MSDKHLVSRSTIDLLHLIHDIASLKKASPSKYSECVQTIQQRFQPEIQSSDFITLIKEHQDLFFFKEISLQETFGLPRLGQAINWVLFSQSHSFMY